MQRSGRMQFEASPRQIVRRTLSQKYLRHTHTHTHTHRAGGVAQVVECLLSNCEALSSSSSTSPPSPRKRKGKKNQGTQVFTDIYKRR
jgi:hypothetical protein